MLRRIYFLSKSISLTYLIIWIDYLLTNYFCSNCIKFTFESYMKQEKWKCCHRIQCCLGSLHLYLADAISQDLQSFGPGSCPLWWYMTQSAEILVRTSLPEILRVVVYINEISIMNTISFILLQKRFTCVAQLRNMTNYGATLRDICIMHTYGWL